jgi:hypothetical protein
VVSDPWKENFIVFFPNKLESLTEILLQGRNKGGFPFRNHMGISKYIPCSLSATVRKFRMVRFGTLQFLQILDEGMGPKWA